jgi:hypothetical protein
MVPMVDEGGGLKSYQGEWVEGLMFLVDYP